MYLEDIFTIALNLAGLPGMSVPCGMVNNLPVGLQLIGNYFDEARLLNAAHQFQQVTDWHQQKPAGVWRGSEMEWEVVIGLEIHAQLATKSKNFLRRRHAVRCRSQHSGLRGGFRFTRCTAGV